MRRAEIECFRNFVYNLIPLSSATRRAVLFSKARNTREPCLVRVRSIGFIGVQFANRHAGVHRTSYLSLSRAYLREKSEMESEGPSETESAPMKRQHFRGRGRRNFFAIALPGRNEISRLSQAIDFRPALFARDETKGRREALLFTLPWKSVIVCSPSEEENIIRSAATVVVVGERTIKRASFHRGVDIAETYRLKHCAALPIFYFPFSFSRYDALGLIYISSGYVRR